MRSSAHEAERVDETIRLTGILLSLLEYVVESRGCENEP